MNMKDFYYTCDCGAEALNVSVDNEPCEGLDFVSYWTLFEIASCHISAWWILKEKIRSFFSILFAGKVYNGQRAVIISKEKLKTLLEDLKRETGYKPKRIKHTGLFGTYFKDFDTFNLLLIEPNAEDESVDVWMCPNYVMWGKSTRWAKAWRVLTKGCWTVDYVELEDEETKSLMDYLNTILSLKWEDYIDDDKDHKEKID